MAVDEVEAVDVAGVAAEVVGERMPLISQLRTLTRNWRPIMLRPCISHEAARLNFLILALAMGSLVQNQ